MARQWRVSAPRCGGLPSGGQYPANVTESNTWPAFLRQAMDNAGIPSPARLADASGIDRSVISNWLGDKVQPTIPNLKRLVAPLGIPLLRLMQEAGLISEKEASLKDAPKGPKLVPVDVVEQEILAAGFPPEVEKQLLKVRQDNREQLRAMIEMLRAAGRLNGKSNDSNSA